MKLRPRYFVALLWHWSIPFLLGSAFSFLLMAWQLTELAPVLEQSFSAAAKELCQ